MSSTSFQTDSHTHTHTHTYTGVATSSRKRLLDEEIELSTGADPRDRKRPKLDETASRPVRRSPRHAGKAASLEIRDVSPAPQPERFELTPSTSRSTSEPENDHDSYRASSFDLCHHDETNATWQEGSVSVAAHSSCASEIPEPTPHVADAGIVHSMAVSDRKRKRPSEETSDDDEVHGEPCAKRAKVEETDPSEGSPRPLRPSLKGRRNLRASKPPTSRESLREATLEPVETDKQPVEARVAPKVESDQPTPRPASVAEDATLPRSRPSSSPSSHSGSMVYHGADVKFLRLRRPPSSYLAPNPVRRPPIPPADRQPRDDFSFGLNARERAAWRTYLSTKRQFPAWMLNPNRPQSVNSKCIPRKRPVPAARPQPIRQGAVIGSGGGGNNNATPSSSIVEPVEVPGDALPLPPPDLYPSNASYVAPQMVLDPDLEVTSLMDRNSMCHTQNATDHFLGESPAFTSAEACSHSDFLGTGTTLSPVDASTEGATSGFMGGETSFTPTDALSQGTSTGLLGGAIFTPANVPIDYLGAGTFTPIEAPSHGTVNSWGAESIGTTVHTPCQGTSSDFSAESTYTQVDVSSQGATNCSGAGVIFTPLYPSSGGTPSELLGGNGFNIVHVSSQGATNYLGAGSTLSTVHAPSHGTPSDYVGEEARYTQVDMSSQGATNGLGAGTTFTPLYTPSRVPSELLGGNDFNFVDTQTRGPTSDLSTLSTVHTPFQGTPSDFPAQSIYAQVDVSSQGASNCLGAGTTFTPLDTSSRGTPSELLGGNGFDPVDTQTQGPTSDLMGANSPFTPPTLQRTVVEYFQAQSLCTPIDAPPYLSPQESDTLPQREDTCMSWHESDDTLPQHEEPCIESDDTLSQREEPYMSPQPPLVGPYGIYQGNDTATLSNNTVQSADVLSWDTSHWATLPQFALFGTQHVLLTVQNTSEDPSSPSMTTYLSDNSETFLDWSVVEDIPPVEYSGTEEPAPGAVPDVPNLDVAPDATTDSPELSRVSSR